MDKARSLEHWPIRSMQCLQCPLGLRSGLSFNHSHTILIRKLDEIERSVRVCATYFFQKCMGRGSNRIPSRLTPLRLILTKNYRIALFYVLFKITSSLSISLKIFHIFKICYLTLSYADHVRNVRLPLRMKPLKICQYINRFVVHHGIR